MPYDGDGSIKGGLDRLSPGSEAVEWKPTDRERLRVLADMMQRTEDMRQQAQIFEISSVEEILGEACQEMLLVWARIRKDNRNGND